MKLNQWLNGDGIFEAMNSIRILPFLEDDLTELDQLLVMYHGERTLFKPVETVSVQVMAKMLLTQLVDRWFLYVKQAALLDTVNNKTVLTETVQDNQTRINVREDVNKISAFNSTELITNDGSDSEGSDEFTGSKTRTLTNEQINARNDYELLSTGSKRSILNAVVLDVSEALTLNIY